MSQMVLRRPLRVGEKDYITEFYPNELTESGGKLFLFKDGEQVQINPPADDQNEGTVKISNDIPLPLSDNGSPGSSVSVSRSDHTHPREGMATESYVDNKISAVIGSSPELMNTLEELAAALGNDPNFASTVLDLIGKKNDKISGTQGQYVGFDSTGAAKASDFKSEIWTFTLADGTVLDKEVLLR